MEMTNLLLKLCLIKYILYINVFNLKNWLILIVDSLQKWLAHSFTNREYSNFTLLNLGKLRYLSHYLSGKCLNGSVVNRGLSILLRESLESTLSPFKQKKTSFIQFDPSPSETSKNLQNVVLTIFQWVLYYCT